MAQIRIGMADVVVGGILIASVAGVALAAISANRETANRVTCSMNLRMIGQGILLYTNENRRMYPRVRHDAALPPTMGTPYEGAVTPSTSADPFVEKWPDHPDKKTFAPAANDVTAAMFLLLRTQDLLPSVFICPSTRAKPRDFDGHSVLEFTNFSGKADLGRHLSYSYQNPYPSADATGRGFKLNSALPAEFAVLADLNPGGDALPALRPDAPVDELRKGNSRNHAVAGVAEGQNVLYADGHVEFQQTPFAGQLGDNIYVANDAAVKSAAAKERGTPAFNASPADAYDTILLPVAGDVGADRPLAKVDAPTDGAAALVAKLAGAYERDPVIGDATMPDGNLVLDQKQLSGKVTLRVNAKAIDVKFNGRKATFAYKVAGTREGRSLVLTLTGGGLTKPTEAEATFVGDWLYLDADEPTGLLRGAAGAGQAWMKAKDADGTPQRPARGTPDRSRDR